MATYRPYKGGAGPSEEQARENTLALFERLQQLGFVVEFVEADGRLQLEYPVVVCGEKIVGYDRWGFCSEEVDRLDQASWDQTLAYFGVGQ